MSGNGKQYVLSVLIADRVGILSEITTAVTELGANITGISQTVVQGYFTVILIAEFDAEIEEQTLCKAVENRFRAGETSVIVKRFVPARRIASAGDRYILTMSGRDRPGILKTLTAYLAEKKINVEDLFFRITGEHVTHIGEVTVPGRLDVKQVQNELCALMAPMGLAVSLQHENLFRAMNEVGSVGLMLQGQRHV